MFSVQILIVFYGIITLVTSEILHPEGNYKTKETKQTIETKAELQPLNTDRKPAFVVNLPSSKTKDEKNKGPNAMPHNNTHSSPAIFANANGTLNHIISNLSHDDLPKNPKINKTLEEKTDEVTSGAIARGILVFVALAFLFILYVGIKTYRRKTQDKKCTMVRKYGVRARRTDVEMEPLPLSDDDEDETVFDLTTSRGNN